MPCPEEFHNMAHEKKLRVADVAYVCSLNLHNSLEDKVIEQVKK